MGAWTSKKKILGVIAIFIVVYLIFTSFSSVHIENFGYEDYTFELSFGDIRVSLIGFMSEEERDGDTYRTRTSPYTVFVTTKSVNKPIDVVITNLKLQSENNGIILEIPEKLIESEKSPGVEGEFIGRFVENRLDIKIHENVTFSGVVKFSINGEEFEKQINHTLIKKIEKKQYPPIIDVFLSA